jgi:hypothetical protein
MASPRSFAKKMRAYKNDIPKQVNEIKKQAVQEIVLQVVPDTPVRSGQARSNYFTTNGSANTSVTAHGPFTQDGYQSINRMRVALQGARPGIPMHITNNLPYIGRLNDGYSAQAPANFIQIAIARAQGIIRRQVIRYGGYNG